MARVVVEVVGHRVIVRCKDAAFASDLTRRYEHGAPTFEEVLPADRVLRARVADGVATVEQAGRVGTIELASGEVTTPPSLVFADAVVRAAVTWQLADHGAILLHAAAVCDERGATVVFGRSGSGKSTVARAAERALSDELVALVPGANADADDWDVVGTSWWQGTRARAPLTRLVWLVRGEPPSVRPCEGGELLRALAAEACRCFPDAGFQRRVFDACARLASRGSIRVAAGEGRAAAAVLEALA